MDLDPILSALSKLEQSINDRYNDLNDRYNDKYQLVLTQLDALNVKLDFYPDKFQQVNTKLEEFDNKFTILIPKVMMLDWDGCPTIDKDYILWVT